MASVRLLNAMTYYVYILPPTDATFYAMERCIEATQMVGKAMPTDTAALVPACTRRAGWGRYHAERYYILLQQTTSTMILGGAG